MFLEELLFARNSPIFVAFGYISFLRIYNFFFYFLEGGNRGIGTGGKIYFDRTNGPGEISSCLCGFVCRTHLSFGHSTPFLQVNIAVNYTPFSAFEGDLKCFLFFFSCSVEKHNEAPATTTTVTQICFFLCFFFTSTLFRLQNTDYPFDE